MDALPILNESQTPKRANESNYEAYEDIIQKVNASTEKVTLLFTGPLTDLAKAMCHDQSFLSNVEKLVWMGGTFLDKGNVEEPEHDGTAEWNAFWDPEAVKTVFDSNLKIDMVALESTNQAFDIRCAPKMGGERGRLIFRSKLCCSTTINAFLYKFYILFMGCSNNCICWYA